jgi:hypothetical protein
MTDDDPISARMFQKPSFYKPWVTKLDSRRTFLEGMKRATHLVSVVSSIISGELDCLIAYPS